MARTKLAKNVQAERDRTQRQAEVLADTPTHATRDSYRERLGMAIVHSAPDRITGEMSVGSEHLDPVGVVRGVALQAFADELAAFGAALGAARGTVIAPLETHVSHFRRSVSRALGAEAVPLHVGASSMVWQTSVYEAGGDPIAMVTHTFLVSAPDRAASIDTAPADKGVAMVQANPAEGRKSDAGRGRLSAEVALTQRRAHIAASACKVISRYGFSASSIRAIADEAGLHVPTLYQYVDSKDEVLELVFHWLVDQVRMDIEVATQSCSTAHQKLLAIIGTLTWRGDQNRSRIGMLNRELKSLSPKARLQVMDEIQTLMRQIAAVIEEGVVSGEFRSVEPLVAANFVDAVVDVWALRQFSIKRIGVKAFEAELVRFLEAALLRA
jgi:uncharacterized protein (TIGR00369 family)